MEEFLLRLFLARYELNVVDDENVRVPVFLTEQAHRTGVETFNKRIREILSLEIYDNFLGIGLKDPVCNRVEKMRFSDAGRTLHEERVELGRRLFRDRFCSGKSESVGRAYDEIIERIAVGAVEDLFVVR